MPAKHSHPFPTREVAAVADRLSRLRTSIPWLIVACVVMGLVSFQAFALVGYVVVSVETGDGCADEAKINYGFSDTPDYGSPCPFYLLPSLILGPNCLFWAFRAGKSAVRRASELRKLLGQDCSDWRD